MTKRFQWGEYAVDVDEDATRAWYAQAEVWSCPCQDCQNFLVLAKTGALPGSVLSLLGTLGIPPEKATYVCAYKDGDRRWYDFSYRIAGRIVKGEDPHIRGEIAPFHETYPHGAPGFPEPHFDLGFCYALPWVIETPRGEGQTGDENG